MDFGLIFDVYFYILRSRTQHAAKPLKNIIVTMILYVLTHLKDISIQMILLGIRFGA